MRVVVAMSGGVDSSVSALLLREQGHDVLGVFLRNGVEAGARGKGHGCCGATDARDAEEVAANLGIPFYALDHAAPFGRIIDDFVAAYARGETPNPCMQCNRDLKFGALLEFAERMGAERLATGHYARLVSRDDGVEPSNGAECGDAIELRRARDPAKDQSYVLATVAPEALARSCFPIGALLKSEVRERARRAGLPVHSKPESQEICFVPTGDYRDLVRARRPELFQPGEIRDLDGHYVGTHEGTAGFTVGQRRGLGIAFGEPRYVVATEPATNRVIVGRRADLAQLHARLHAPNPLAPAHEWAVGARVELQVRAHHAPVAGTVAAIASDLVEVALDPPGESLTPGQVGVLYRGDRALLAGTLRP